MAKLDEFERGFLARVFYRRGGKTTEEQFVEAKKFGVNDEWFADPKCRVVWLGAERMFSSESGERTLFSLIKHSNAVSQSAKDETLQNIKVDKTFFDSAEKLVNGTDELAEYFNLLRDQHLERLCKRAFATASEGFASGQKTTDVIASLINSAQGIIKDSAASGKVSIADTFDDLLAQYDSVHHHVHDLGETNYTPGLPLPFQKLSYAMNGFPSVLTILAARPGVGKTSFAVTLVRYWMDMNVKVVLNSLDMSAVELLKRQVAEFSQISSRQMQFAKDTPDAWKNYNRPAIVKAGEWLKKKEEDHVLTVYTQPDIDVLKANVKILKDQGLIDVLVVDYLQLMGYRGSERQSTVQRVSRVSNLLHSISTELGVPVLALSQINRDSSREGNEPQLHDIKDSGAIEQDATNVLILHPRKDLRDKWMETPPEGYAGSFGWESIKSYMPMTLIVAKARDGDAGTKLPFLVIQNKYSWYLCDWKNPDKDDKFLRVYSNWKHDPIEKSWAEKGVLLSDELEEQIEAKNAQLAQSQISLASSSSTYSFQDSEPSGEDAREDPADYEGEF